MVSSLLVWFARLDLVWFQRLKLESSRARNVRLAFSVMRVIRRLVVDNLVSSIHCCHSCWHFGIRISKQDYANLEWKVVQSVW
jgi:hypothetical protein